MVEAPFHRMVKDSSPGFVDPIVVSNIMEHQNISRHVDVGNGSSHWMVKPTGASDLINSARAVMHFAEAYIPFSSGAKINCERSAVCLAGPSRIYWNVRSRGCCVVQTPTPPKDQQHGRPCPESPK